MTRKYDRKKYSKDELLFADRIIRHYKGEASESFWREMIKRFNIYHESTVPNSNPDEPAPLRPPSRNITLD